MFGMILPFPHVTDLHMHNNPGSQAKFPVQGQVDVSPKGFRRSLVCGRNPGVACAGPEPPVHVDRLELTLLASLALEVALAARSVDC